jgi:hypothetical protein
MFEVLEKADNASGANELESAKIEETAKSAIPQ